jgi:hypothetical protein
LPFLFYPLCPGLEGFVLEEGLLDEDIPSGERKGHETVTSLLDQVEGFLTALDESRKGAERGDEQVL